MIRYPLVEVSGVVVRRACHDIARYDGVQESEGSRAECVDDASVDAVTVVVAVETGRRYAVVAEIVLT